MIIYKQGIEDMGYHRLPGFPFCRFRKVCDPSILSLEFCRWGVPCSLWLPINMWRMTRENIHAFFSSWNFWAKISFFNFITNQYPRNNNQSVLSTVSRGHRCFLICIFFFFFRRGSLFKYSLFCGGRFSALPLQVHSRRLLVGRCHNDHGRLRWHDVCSFLG